MTDAERIYALYVQANPVPDPGSLPLTRGEAVLLPMRRAAMQTETPRRVQPVRPPPRWRRIWVPALAGAAAVITVALAFIAFGGDDTDLESVPPATDQPAATTVAAVPAEVQQLLDDYLASWENDDEAALRQAVTEDYTFNDHVYLHHVAGNRLGTHLDEGLSKDGLAAVHIIAGPLSRGYQVEQTGPTAITDDGPPWFVSVRETRTTEGIRDDGVATYVIVERDGALKIGEHTWIGLHSATD